MSALEKLVGGVLAAVILGLIAWYAVDDYGADRYQAGYTAAVAVGDAARDLQAAANRKTETALRDQLHAQDLDASQKEQAYASSLEAAQRRVRAGIDSLRCPAGPVPGAAAAGDRLAAGGPEPETDGPRLVPETAADLLGIASDVAGLVRRYDRVVERFEACRAVNAK
jgi:hypothetical protein